MLKADSAETTTTLCCTSAQALQFLFLFLGPGSWSVFLFTGDVRGSARLLEPDTGKSVRKENDSRVVGTVLKACSSGVSS